MEPDVYRARFGHFNDRRLIPPGIHDERSRAVLAAFAHGAALFDASRLLMRTGSEMSDEVLPLAIHERSLDEYILPEGYPAATVRGFVDASFDIHTRQGTEDGIRFGLGLLGANATITQWYDSNPPAHHDTFRVVIEMDRPLPGVEVNTSLDRKAVTRMIEATQRWSQDAEIIFGYRTRGAIYVAAVAVTGGTLHHQNEPPGDQSATHVHGVGCAAWLTGTLQHGNANHA